MADEIYGPPAPGTAVSANTGKNDPNSVWGVLGTALTTGAGLYNSVKGTTNSNSNKTTTPVTAPVAASSSGFDFKKWLPYIAGAAALVTILAFFLRRK